MLNKIVLVAGFLFTVFTAGYFKAKGDAKNKQLQNALENAKEVKKRQFKRDNDSTAIIKRRLRKNARD